MRRVGRAMAVMGLLAVAMGLSAAGCAPDGPRTVVIGDSLTVGAQEQGLGTRGAVSWRIDAESGRTTNEGIEVAKRFGIDADDTVIVALGTNDYLDDKATYTARIDRMMKVVGKAKRIVWVNVDAHTSKLSPASLGVNPAISAAAARYSKLRVGDWHTYVTTVSGFGAMREADRVHYTAKGDAVRARWMERQATG